jgi:deoxyguanosine kinase
MFIAIEGNIGTGKTTLCHMMEAQTGCALLLEQFTDNPFLPFFYQQPERYAFPVELFFMAERHKQLQEHFAEPELFQRDTLADYFFVKTLLFAKNNLSDEEFRLFQRLFGVLNATYPKPDLLVYLHRPVDVLVRQIAQRGREMEQSISAEYLESIQDAYFEYFKTETEVPIVVLDLGEADFQRDQVTFQRIKDLLRGGYQAGLQHIRI